MDSGLFSITLTSLISRLTKTLERCLHTCLGFSILSKKSQLRQTRVCYGPFSPLDGARLSKLMVIFNILSHNDEAGWAYLQPNSPEEEISGPRCLPPSVKSQSADVRNRWAHSALRKLPSFSSASRHKQCQLVLQRCISCSSGMVRPADQETTATEKAVCGPRFSRGGYTPPLRAPQGSPRAADGRGEHDHELSRWRLQEGVGEAGKRLGSAGAEYWRGPSGLLVWYLGVRTG